MYGHLDYLMLGYRRKEGFPHKVSGRKEASPIG